MDVTNFNLSQKAGLGLAYLPQESSVFRELSVEDNIRLACEIVYGKDEDLLEKKVNELLVAFGVEHIKSRQAYKLSGGERRRVEIARSLALRPKFLLLDEPFAGVDPLAVADIQQIVKNLCASGIGVLITDHSFREALAICTRAYVLNEGEMLASGTPQEIYANENVKRFYLGEAL
jgi:lipopolysaccharide export system ATP-binding protein